MIPGRRHRQKGIRLEGRVEVENGRIVEDRMSAEEVVEERRDEEIPLRRRETMRQSELLSDVDFPIVPRALDPYNRRRRIDPTDRRPR